MRSLIRRKTYEQFPLLSIVCSIFCSSVFTGCSVPPEPGSPEQIEQAVSSVSDEKLQKSDQFVGDWLTHGLNYSETRHSPLDQINPSNIESLGLAWSLNLGTKRGVESTPLVVDGIMYLTGPWSLVYAVNARSGELIWKYDPMVPGKYGEKACCDVVNRGLAMYEGKVYVGTIDGRLIAIDAVRGKPVWEVYTVDTTKYYSITGAPRVANGKVVIGNGGAEYGVRGYFTAYDARTGDLVWRFYTVPGDPAKPFESPAMEKAAKTWSGTWWEYGGGGTAWDAMAYDPALKFLYVGTGNGSPWVGKYRSPGGGDNLFLSSIVAVNIENGELVWHYQTTPGESWDYTATQHIILADVQWQGETRKVLMQAPKNGFFYVLDRESGELLSADPYVYVNWAKAVDLQSGRPLEHEFSRYEEVNFQVAPNYEGGHNWHPMAFNPTTGLVYIPALDNASVYGADPEWEAHKAGFAVGNGWNAATGYDPSKEVMRDSMITWSYPGGKLMAWDPVKAEKVWEVQHPTPWNAGVLSTGKLIFQGTTDGRFCAYDAEDGTKLWETDLEIGVIAPPITYEIDGIQYVSIAAGWGGGVGQKMKFTDHILPGTVFTFALNHHARYPQYPDPPAKELIDLPLDISEAARSQGASLFTTYCALCHASVGSGGGNIPDLGYSSKETYAIFHSIVLEGAYLARGMPNFSDRLDPEKVTLIKNYLISAAQKVRERENVKN
ncbi:MAG: PQQ-dependent dehydrogenase, methanol/ethanol family [Saprospiraceae bacterium]|nr:PQQ-dependent dehydrogenase, methanol/ethanol family [Saprospiraceae bacterium]